MQKYDKRAFFIMPFGKPDLELIWSEVYEPISNSLGFEAVRSDRRDSGQIVLDQIINDISSSSDIIIGDLTYERPNCYFELGYARAIRKHFEVILCARRDHVDHSQYSPTFFNYEPPLTFFFSMKPKYVPPKVHFDLAGFDILVWDEKKVDAFKEKFKMRFEERFGIYSRTQLCIEFNRS